MALEAKKLKTLQFFRRQGVPSLSLRFDRLKCFSGSDSNDEDSGSDSSKESGVTTATQEEAEERRSNEVDSEESTSSVSFGKVWYYLFQH